MGAIDDMDAINDIEYWIQRTKIILYGMGLRARICRSIVKNKIYYPCIAVESIARPVRHKFIFNNLHDASVYTLCCNDVLKAVGFKTSIAYRTEFDYTAYRKNKRNRLS